MKHKIIAGIALATIPMTVIAAQVFTQDVVVKGSECVGVDCSSNERFGFDTVRLKENNLRIKFDDTSSSASFPKNDWELTANDSRNGGDSYFAITDSTARKVPFKVEAGAPKNALLVASEGRIGIKQANPAVDLHITEGNTPTVRLEQDGSNGFTPQVWDMAGNETNFFIRDVTNGSKLPFRIKPNAPKNSIFVAADGDIGFSTENPSAPLHLVDNNDDWTLNMIVENTNAINFAGIRLKTPLGYIDLNNSQNDFRINFNDTPGPELNLDENGNLTITGDITFKDNGVKITLSDLIDRIEALEAQ